MRDAVADRLRLATGLYRDLMAGLPDGALGLRLPELPSNSIGSQLWCVVGARESYAKAIRAGRWQGFSCRLSRSESKRPARVAEALEQTAALAEACAVDPAIEWDDERDRLLLSLLEHEVQHHGQLIRYLYGNRLSIPDSWKERYALG